MLRKTSSNKRITLDTVNMKLGRSNQTTTSFLDLDFRKLVYISLQSPDDTRVSISTAQNKSLLITGTGTYSLAGYKGTTNPPIGAIKDSGIASSSDGGWRFSTSYTNTHVIKQLFEQVASYTLTLYFKVTTSTGSNTTSSGNNWTSINMREARHGTTAYSTFKRTYASFDSSSATWKWTSGYSDVYGYGLGEDSGDKVYIKLE